jgi:hypothetical protein
MTKKKHRDVSDDRDPELDELEPVHQERQMNPVPEYPPDHPAEDSGQAEMRDYPVTGPLVARGQQYDVGQRIVLTEEEHASLVAAGANVEGVEPKSPEEAQAAHDEGREALQARLDEMAEKEAEAKKAAAERA